MQPALSNSPPSDADILRDSLREQSRDLVSRIDELTASANRRTVADDDDAGKATLLVKQILEEERAVAARQKEAKRPHAELADAAFGYFKPMLLQLESLKRGLLGKLDAYRRELEQRAQAERRRLAQEAALKAAEAAEADDLDSAMDAEQASQRIVEQAATVAPAPIRSDYGHVASARKTWEYELVDLAAVPRQFLMLNDAAIKAHIKTRQKDRPPVPVAGLTFIERTSTVVR